MNKDFEDLLTDINKRYDGVAVISKASDSDELQRPDFIRTGILALDTALGGGVPVGRILYIRGEYSSGKTLLSLKCAAAYQRHCRNCCKPMYDWDEIRMKKTHKKCCKDPEGSRVVWMDAEKSWDSKWAARQGVDPKKLYVMRTEFAEQSIDVADDLIRSGQVDLLVVDSVAHLTPSIEIIESAEKMQMAAQAKLMNKAMRVWGSAMSHDSVKSGRMMGCSIILINQIRHRIGVFYGSPETSPGGRGMDFAADIKLKVKKKGYLKNKMGMTIGQNIEIVAEKNKLAPPMRTNEFDIAFVSDKASGRVAGSTNYEMQVLRLANYWGLVQLAGSWYTLAKGIRHQGEKKAADWLASDAGEPVLKMLDKEIWKRERAWTEDGEVDEM